MSKSLIETFEEENKVARAKAEQVQQVKEAMQERTETTKTLIEYQKAVAEQNKSLQENQQTLYDAINNAKDSFDIFENKADNLTQQNIKALENAVNNLKSVLANIDSNISTQIKNNFDKNVGHLNNAVNDSINILTDTTTKAQEIINNRANSFDNILKDSEKELKHDIKKISSKSSFLVIIGIILLIIPNLYCLNWQFNFIPFLQQKPITDMFIMGFVCAFAIIIVFVILIKLIHDKLQN